MLGDHVGVRDIATMPDGRTALLLDGFSVAFLTISRKRCGGDPKSSRHIHTLHCGDALVEASEPVLSPANASDPSVRRDNDTDDRGALSDGAALFASHCGRCHRARTRQHDVGPHLVGVIGRRAGAVAGYDYSAVFAELDHVWTKGSLANFLIATEDFASGGAMPNIGISKAQAREIVDYLESANEMRRVANTIRRSGVPPASREAATPVGMRARHPGLGQSPRRCPCFIHSGRADTGLPSSVGECEAFMVFGTPGSVRFHRPPTPLRGRGRCHAPVGSHSWRSDPGDKSAPSSPDTSSRSESVCRESVDRSLDPPPVAHGGRARHARQGCACGPGRGAFVADA